MKTNERTDYKATVRARLAALELARIANFVPASQFKGDEWREKAINHRVTLQHRGRDFVTVNYSYGVGNLPGYKASVANKLAAEQAMRNALDRGMWPIRFDFDNINGPTHKVPVPDLADVMASLLLDASAIDYATFEDWASEYGYDADSRTAETTYRECLHIGLALRSTLGDAVLAELRELFQEW